MEGAESWVKRKVWRYCEWEGEEEEPKALIKDLINGHIWSEKEEVGMAGRPRPTRREHNLSKKTTF